MKTKFKGILTLLLAFVVQITFAQEMEISGVVSDEFGPLAGANILIEGTTKGTDTDLDGKYTLKANKGEVIIYSFVGMKAQKIKVGNSKKIDILLEGDNELTTIVITGYSSTKKESQVGSSKQVKASVIQAKATSDITKALAGEVSGVSVQNTNGQPGSSARVRIRGISSLGGLNSPLYVVDGVPYEGDTNELNQSDIESFTVLKDASATAIYGSRGSNGVVVIVTKKGKKGTSYIEVESKSGVSMELLSRYEMLEGFDNNTEFMWSVLKGKKSAEDQIAFAKDPTHVSLTDTELGEYASAFLFSDDPNDGAIQTFYNMYNQSGVDLIDPITGKMKDDVTRRYTPEDWNEHLFGIGFRHENTVKLSGGNDKTQYYTSIGYLDDNGYAKKTNFNRITARANVNHEVNDWLKGSINMAFVNSKTTGASGLGGNFTANPFYFAKSVPSFYPIYERDADGNKIDEPYFGGYLYDAGSGPGRTNRLIGGDNSPLVASTYNYSGSNAKKFTGNQYLEAKLVKGLKVASRFGYEYLNNVDINRVNPFYGPGLNDKGTIRREVSDITFYTWTKMLMYNFELAENHNFDFLMAHENSDYSINVFSAQKKRLVDAFGNDLANALTDEQKSTSSTRSYAIESVFGKLKYDFSEKYLASLTFRRDGSSKFSRDKWANFGALGLGWNMHKEDFLMDSKLIKKLKLRGSYGLTGSQGTTSTYGIRSFYANQELNSVGNLTGNPTLSVYSMGNPDLTWETAVMMQFGVDFNLLDKVEGSFDYYIKDTQNMFYDQKGGISLGYSSIKVNDGEMRSSGFEFDLKYYAIDTNDFKLDLLLNGEMIRNKITKMPINPATNKPTIINGDISEGRSVYDLFMPEWAGVNEDTGRAQWWAYYDDKNNDDVRTEDENIPNMPQYMANNKGAKVKKDLTEKYGEATDKYIDKKTMSDVRGAFGLNIEYKGVSLTSQFLYGIGGYIYDSEYAGYMSDRKIGSGSYHKDVMNRWKKPGDKTDVPRYSGTADTGAGRYSTRFLTKKDYLALNNVKLGYSFPKAYLDGSSVNKLSIYVSGDNLWVASHRKGLNPSRGGGVSNNVYSPLSTLTLGVNVKF